MTRQELYTHLETDALERRENGGDNFCWGVWTDVHEDRRMLILIRQIYEGPFSVTTFLEVQDASEEWKALTEAWELKWQSVYQVVTLEFTQRFLHLDEDPRNFPSDDFCIGSKNQSVQTLDEVENILQQKGKSLADIVAIAADQISLLAEV